MKNPSQDLQKTRISARSWITIILLGLIGQLAWNVEANWFNTFVFDKVTPDPAPIAWMVGISAVLSTLTTFFIGTWSDRAGRRKPFLFWGYVLWGVATALFPTAIFFKLTSIVIVMVIVFDGVMTCLGSTANDASFNAWLTDITDETNRGKVLGVTIFFPFLAAALVGLLGGTVIDNFGYFTFFYVFGGIVLVSGLFVKPLVREAEHLAPSRQGSFWKQLTSLFEWKTVRNNPKLFLLFISILISSTASQINLPYMYIYLENSVGISKSMIGFITLVLTLISGLAAFILGQYIDRWDRKKTAILAGIIASIGIFVFGLLRTIPHFYLLGWMYIAPGLIYGIATGAWIMDLYPKGERGGFQGVRMVFQVMLPMMIGPQIGSLLISYFGIPTTLNGESGFIPTPQIFFVSALVYLLALVPILLIKKQLQKSDAG